MEEIPNSTPLSHPIQLGSLVSTYEHIFWMNEVETYTGQLHRSQHVQLLTQAKNHRLDPATWDHHFSPKLPVDKISTSPLNFWKCW